MHAIKKVSVTIPLITTTSDIGTMDRLVIEKALTDNFVIASEHKILFSVGSILLIIIVSLVLEFIISYLLCCSGIRTTLLWILRSIVFMPLLILCVISLACIVSAEYPEEIKAMMDNLMASLLFGCYMILDLFFQLIE